MSGKLVSNLKGIFGKRQWIFSIVGSFVSQGYCICATKKIKTLGDNDTQKHFGY